MNDAPKRLSMEDFDRLCRRRLASGAPVAAYEGPLARHVADGDRRLLKLQYDDSPAALRLWSFLLTEEERLHAARAAGKKIVGAMKDLGTVPVMAYALPNLVAFYPDGAWWTPCVMELSEGLFGLAQSLGLGDAMCPVRAMAAAFVNRAHFPIPDLLTCSVGATCDDFSAVAQRLESLGHPILWWEMPARRRPDAGEPAVTLPGGFSAPESQVAVVRSELERIRAALADLAGLPLGDAQLAAGIREANRVRALLADLRRLAYTAELCPMPALEMLIAEMLAIHFCSDREESVEVLAGLLAEVRRRTECKEGVLPAGAARVFWVNPVADLRVMNLLEDCGARLCGTEFLFCHALDTIPTDLPPMEALARMALADPMVGPSADRAARIVRDAREFGAEAVVISRIPGASHCAMEGGVIGDIVRQQIGLPVVELEVPPLADPLWPTLKTRLEALVETVLERRKR
ncbi:MAG: 2-hydroxyacyl-CoA dehydratase family protein [Planctomycetota bacterium]|nr:2-hydroxyacyl-CoA dehydratase family protein [Planctomycetota bacterium]